MPLYRYRCTSCGFEYDDIAPMDSVNPTCAELVPNETDANARCRGAMVRVPSAIGVRVQGGTPKFYPNRGPR